jgi:predicted transcriptional regulator/transcriptional regulator with XRE-family HTH domain
MAPAAKTSLMLSGRKVRRLREGLELTQVEMARRLGLSASYLNLIEHGQRPLTTRLQAHLCDTLDVDPAELSDEEEAHLAADLAEVLSDSLFADRVVSRAEIRETVGGTPEIGRAMLALYRAYRSAREEVGDLGEALRNREVLAGINYELRTLLTSIRSFSEILRDNPGLDLEQRQRFLGIIITDSQRLLPLVGGLLDGHAGEPAADGAGRPASEDVADLFQANAGYFAELEEVAEEIRRAVGVERACDYESLTACLAHDHGLAVRIVEHREGSRVGDWYDAAARRLDLSEMLAPESRCFRLARHLALLRSSEQVAGCLDGVRFSTPEARALAIDALGDYVADAVMMPYAAFLAAAREFRHDLDRLRRRFGVGLERVCRRLTTLQRPGAKGTPFHLVRVDMAGNVTWRFSASGLRIARFGGVCPLWNLHAAFLTPGLVRTQLSRMPDGLRYFSIARTLDREGPPARHPPRLSAIELGCEVSFAADITYADGLNLGDGNAVPIGTTCRLCERSDCPERVLPPFRQPPATDLIAPPTASS